MKNNIIIYICVGGCFILIFIFLIGNFILKSNNSKKEDILNYECTEIMATDIKQNPKLFYGKYVNYGGEYKKGDYNTYQGVNWRIFNIGKDENENDIIQLIADNYVNTKIIDGTETIETGYSAGNDESFFCGIKGKKDRTDLLNYLTDSSNWDMFKADGIDCMVKGGPSVEEFANSYNSIYNSEEILYNNIMGNYAIQGYLIDWNKEKIKNNEARKEYIDGLSSDPDNLYFCNDKSRALGYWICGFSASSFYHIMFVFYNGQFGHSDFSYYVGGVRPIISLKFNTKLKLESNGSYSIIN